MLGNVYGLDLGTYEIKIFDKKKDRIWREKDSIAMKNKRYVYAVGNERTKCLRRRLMTSRSSFL